MNLLNGTLILNAATSAAIGAALAIGAIPISDWLGIPTPVSLALGIGLVAFGALVLKVARDARRQLVLEVIAADLAWVVGAGVVIFGFPDSMSTAGRWSLGVVTVAVAVFATLQATGLRRSGFPA